MRKVELLPTRDCEAGYGPAVHECGLQKKKKKKKNDFQNCTENRSRIANSFKGLFTGRFPIGWLFSKVLNLLKSDSL